MFKTKQRYLSTLAFILVMFTSHVSSIEVNAPLINVTLPDIHSNASISLDKFKGKVVYLDFWASWCGPCRQSLPAMNRLFKKYRGQGFVVYAINLDKKKSDGLEMSRFYSLQFPVLWDKEGLSADAYQLPGMPSSYLIDKEGIVRFLHKGFRTGDAERLEKLIQALIDEKETGNVSHPAAD